MNTKKLEINWDFVKKILSNQNIDEVPISYSIDETAYQGILGNIVKLKLQYENNRSENVIVKFQGCSNKTRESNI